MIRSKTIVKQIDINLYLNKGMNIFDSLGPNKIQTQDPCHMTSVA